MKKLIHFLQGYSSSAVKRIYKEGRKYGIGTFITLRLSSSDDQSIIRSTAPNNSSGLSDLFPSLSTEKLYSNLP